VRFHICCFLDLTIADDIPDSKTIWHFSERLTDLELTKELFDLFTRELNKLNLIVNKEGKGDGLWEDKPNKKAQKDVDARWTKKNNQNYYGYKNHAKIDGKSKLIETYKVTQASTHDSQTLDDLLEESDNRQDLHADSAYTGEAQEETVSKYKMNNKIHEKGTRNHPLTAQQKASNKEKSKTRVRVEHVFGFMENSMGSMFYRKIGLKRAETVIGLMNLTYNMFRKIQLTAQPMGTCT